MSMSSEGLAFRRPRPLSAPDELRDWSFRVHTTLRSLVQKEMERQQLDHTTLAELVGYNPKHLRRVLIGRSKLSVQMYLILATALRLEPSATLATAITR